MNNIESTYNAMADRYPFLNQVAEWVSFQCFNIGVTVWDAVNEYVKGADRSTLENVPESEAVFTADHNLESFNAEKFERLYALKFVHKYCKPVHYGDYTESELFAILNSISSDDFGDPEDHDIQLIERDAITACCVIDSLNERS